MVVDLRAGDDPKRLPGGGWPGTEAPEKAGALLRAVVALLFVAVCIAWVGASLDLDAALDAVTHARWSMLGPMALAYLAAYLVRSHRLGVLLHCGGHATCRRE